MGDSPLDLALRRLHDAVGSLEAAGARVIEVEKNGAASAGEIAALSADRVRLAEELDALNARASRLDMNNRDVSRRLDIAMDTIRSVLAGRGD
jgi:hypothetical protein